MPVSMIASAAPGSVLLLWVGKLVGGSFELDEFLDVLFDFPDVSALGSVRHGSVAKVVFSQVSWIPMILERHLAAARVTHLESPRFLHRVFLVAGLQTEHATTESVRTLGSHGANRTSRHKGPLDQPGVQAAHHQTGRFAAGLENAAQPVD